MSVIISGDNGISDVDGSAGTPAIRGTDANSGIFFGADQVGIATNGVERVEFGNSETVFNDGGANVDFRVEGDTEANLLFVDASADAVGVGTATPSGKLDISGGILKFTGGNPSNPTDTSVSFYNGAGVGATVSSFQIAFRTGSSTPAERARIDSSGNLLVGTTTAGGRFTASRGDAGTSGYFISGSGAGSGVYAIETSLESASNNSNCAHLRSTTQNVNIWQLLGNGTSTWSSDQRLKKNIETTRNGYIEDLCKLRVVKYNWHNQEDGTPKELGLIAQEVEQVFPGLIVTTDVELNGMTDTKTIKGSVLPYMLLKAIQELKAITDAQASRIETLEAKVAALEAR